MTLWDLASKAADPVEFNVEAARAYLPESDRDCFD